MIAFILSKPGLRQERAEVLKGYDQKADTMYAAKLIVVY